MKRKRYEAKGYKNGNQPNFKKRLLASWLKQLSKMFQFTNMRVNYAVLKKRDREGERKERGERSFPTGSPLLNPYVTLSSSHCPIVRFFYLPYSIPFFPFKKNKLPQRMEKTKIVSFIILYTVTYYSMAVGLYLDGCARHAAVSWPLLLHPCGILYLIILWL